MSGIHIYNKNGIELRFKEDGSYSHGLRVSVTDDSDKNPSIAQVYLYTKEQIDELISALEKAKLLVDA